MDAKKNKVLHLCMTKEVNLGDELAHKAIEARLNGLVSDIDIEKRDIWQFREAQKPLDDEIDTINQQYQLIIIGAGGLLSLGIINYIFSKPSSWSKVTIPIVFYGVGIIGNYHLCQWVLSGLETAHLDAALKAASLISVRDLRTYLVSTKATGKEKVFLTGCPTLHYAKTTKKKPSYSLALNLPFQHGICAEYTKELTALAKSVVKRDGLVWICHSKLEYINAVEFRDYAKAHYDVVQPKSFDEVQEIYSRIDMAVVTKAHSGIFSLANLTPFAFLSYDLKCDALLEMIVDFPCNYLLHIHRLQELDVEKRIESMLSCLEENKAHIINGQKTLLEALSKEQISFEKALAKLL